MLKTLLIFDRFNRARMVVSVGSKEYKLQFTLPPVFIAPLLLCYEYIVVILFTIFFINIAYLIILICKLFTASFFIDPNISTSNEIGIMIHNNPNRPRSVLGLYTARANFVTCQFYQF